MRKTQSRLESKIGLGLSLRTRNASLEAFDYDKDRKVLRSRSSPASPTP